MPPPPKTVLIAPLDWGLGHTTRCVPIIRAIAALGHQVLFAGNERQQAFIRLIFPDIRMFMLEGYAVRYSRRALLLTLLWQIPRLLGVIRREHNWLRRLATAEKIDGVISDNRYGLWHPHIPSVIITHQPGVQTGLGQLSDALARKMHYHFLRRFKAVWIPDAPGRPGLAGSLSHQPILPRNTAYMGWLSQFRKRPAYEGKSKHILILLSGPEPQRRVLADALWHQAQTVQEQIVFVEGRADATRGKIPPHIRYIPLAGGEALQVLLEAAEMVVCRSGYSTLMDLALLCKKAVLIPTPGQTEQEYLAAQGFWPSFPQKGFSLISGIAAARNAHAPDLLQDAHIMLPVIRKWLEGL